MFFPARRKRGWEARLLFSEVFEVIVIFSVAAQPCHWRCFTCSQALLFSINGYLAD